jgi:CRISPR-associated protein Cas1
VPGSEGKLSRLVIEADHGTVTLDALAWCRAVGVQVVGLDREGEQAWSSMPVKPQDARITRALALAGSADDDPVGLEIVRRLLRAKLAGEASVLLSGLLDDLPDLQNAAQTLLGLRNSLDGTDGIAEARQVEATAAAIYWNAWSQSRSTVPRFSKPDARKMPQAWATYPGSHAGRGASNRRATHPTNALLNYSHALARSEAMLVLRRLGLDPGLGYYTRTLPGEPALPATSKKQSVWRWRPMYSGC